MASRLSANGPALRVSLNASWLGFYTTPVKLSSTRSLPVNRRWKTSPARIGGSPSRMRR
jgi:hypothetical protein